MRRLPSLALLLLVTACATVGHKFDPAKADQLTPGVSTLRDASQALGKPTAETNNADGTTLVLWQYSHGNALGSASAQRLAILFDRDGKMVRIAHRAETQVH